MGKDEISRLLSGINNKYDDLFYKYGSIYGVDPKIIKAIAANESVIGKFTSLEPIGGTTGIMHIKLSTARQHEPGITQEDLAVPENEIRVATKHIKWLMGLYSNYSPDKQVQYAVMAYNGGQGRMNQILAGDFSQSDSWYKNMTTYLDRFNSNSKKIGTA